MTAPPESLVRLHASLRERQKPETIAAIIDQAYPVPAGLGTALRAVIKSSIKRYFGWSAMATSFPAPVPMDRQIGKARELAKLFLDRTLPESDDPDALEAFIAAFNTLIGKTPGRASFKEDRLDKAARVATGLDLSRRRYDKLFRLAGRLERRLRALRREEARHRLVLVSKTALAPDLTLDDFGGHLPTAGFVAYYAARMKLRSEFTIDGQQRPFDGLARN